MPLGDGGPWKQGEEKRVPPLKRRYFTFIGLSSVKWLQIGIDMLLIITSTRDEGVNINDLKWPWTPKIGSLVIFCYIRVRHTFQESNCAEMAGDRQWQPAYEFFSIDWTVAFSSLSPDPTPQVQRGMRTRVSKRGNPLKSSYFSLLACLARKRL